MRRLLVISVRAAAAALLLAAAGVVVLALVWKRYPFPIDRLEQWPRSPCVTDRDGEPLLELVGRDDQYRRPVPLEEMSPWVVGATLVLEDERFWAHRGVDPAAVVRAALQNLLAGRVVSGASTLTMQVCKMLDERPRTWQAKLIEAGRALQLETLTSKRHILETYLNMAPYGGNIRGIEEAARFYFSKSAADLSLGEGALLAGLPQAPSRLRPDRHPEAARKRRNLALTRMLTAGLITRADWRRARAEPIAVTADRPEMYAPHFAWMALQRRATGGRTTLRAPLQREVERLARDHVEGLPEGCDLAVVVMEIASGDLLALIGSADPDDPRDGRVNGATARRSPGSALKPFVYATAFEERRLAPDSLLFDGPIQRAGWTPRNFDRRFAGEVRCDDALRRSLNVPAILVAEAMGVGRCIATMRAAGVSLPRDARVTSGLAVVLGSSNVRLLDLVNGYATIGRGGLRQEVRLFADEAVHAERVLSERTCAALDAILSSRRRRPHGMEDLDPAAVPWFMWKTGTSSGRRDAWAVGHNGRYAAGVWVGRFNGAGHPRFVGQEAAEPLLATLFALPELRVDDDPPPGESWQVRHPLRLGSGPGGAVAISEPEDGAVYLAVDGAVTLRPRQTGADHATWFLDGLQVKIDEARGLVLAPGRHELRCVNEAGGWAASRFEVRTSL